jgi:DNA-directed RNA polymerase specialized sigma24 family protein
MSYYEAHYFKGNKKASPKLTDLTAEMDEKCRRVLDLAYFNGFQTEQIENEMNIPLGSTKPRLRRAIRELKTGLSLLVKS